MHVSIYQYVCSFHFMPVQQISNYCLHYSCSFRPILLTKKVAKNAARGKSDLLVKYKISKSHPEPVGTGLGKVNPTLKTIQKAYHP